MVNSFLYKLPPPFSPADNQIRRKRASGYLKTGSTFQHSHRRSGKVTARKPNRTAFFGQPLGWLFFCCSERSKTTYRTDCGREGNYHGNTITRRTTYRPMNHNQHRHVYGSGRSSPWRSSFLYRTACREVSPINNKKTYRNGDFKNEHKCICVIAHRTNRILEERRTQPPA